MKKSVWIALILAAWLASGCVPWPPGYFPTPTPSGSPPTLASQRTNSLVPTIAKPLPSLTPTAEGQPTSTPQPVSPVLSGENIMQLEWSSDSQWLTFLTQTAQEADSIPPENYSGPITGTLHLYNVQTGQNCAYPMENPHRLKLNAWHTWLPDDRLATLDGRGQVLALQPPCSNQVAPVSARERLTLQFYDPNHPDQTFSPKGSYRGFNQKDQEQDQYKTIIERRSNGDLVATFDWRYSDVGSANLVGPAWISDDQFILPHTNAGPLLVTLAQNLQAVPVAPTFFHMDGSASQSAAGLYAPDLHLLLSNIVTDTTQAEVRLYHSQGKDVENLLYTYGAFAPGGGALILGNAAGERWMRPLDPPASPVVKFLETTDQPFPAWSEDGQRVAIASKPDVDRPVSIRVLEAPSGVLLYTWRLGGQYGYYNYTQLAWSPDLSYLAAVGSDLNNPQVRAIFLFEFPAGLRP
jgi:WD40 repeat protein